MLQPFLHRHGDGLLGDGTNPSHIYTLAGMYTVSLKVTNAPASSQMIKRNCIHILTSSGRQR
jgi:PKD repeat protein